MCRQFHEGKGLSIIVLRPCSIVDARLGINKGGTPMTGFSESWVCRHDLAEGCRLALETDSVQFDVFHAAGTPEAAATCDVDRAQGASRLGVQGGSQAFRLSRVDEWLRTGQGSVSKLASTMRVIRLANSEAICAIFLRMAQPWPLEGGTARVEAFNVRTAWHGSAAVSPVGHAATSCWT